MRYYFCIDLKTFYASVECVERGLDPFKTDLVVADKTRGKGSVCLAISPKMKARGIKNRCRMYEIPSNVKPIVAMPRMKKYIEYSARIYKIYLKYFSKEDIYPYSVDEMFMEVTNYLKLYKKNIFELAKTILKDIYDTTGITATVGIGTNLFLTKVALDIKSKHSKTNIGYLDEELFKKEMWHHTPITDFWRISYGTEARLYKHHLKDMYDIAHANPNILYKEFGINAEYLIDHAWGREPVTIKEIKAYRPKRNSISNSQILFEDYTYKKARIVLMEMIDNIILKLIEKNLNTSCVNIYIGYSKNRIKPLKFRIKLNAIDNYQSIVKPVLEEYDFRINKEIPIRRIGITLSQLEIKKYEQLDLFSNRDKENNIIDHVVIDIKNKYGKNAILKAINLSEGATQIKRNKLIGGHNAE